MCLLNKIVHTKYMPMNTLNLNWYGINFQIFNTDGRIFFFNYKFYHWYIHIPCELYFLKLISMCLVHFFNNKFLPLCHFYWFLFS